VRHREVRIELRIKPQTNVFRIRGSVTRDARPEEQRAFAHFVFRSKHPFCGLRGPLKRAQNAAK